MIEKLIELALSKKLATAMFLLIVVISGIACFRMLPMDSFPDVSNVQVQVIVEPESMATEEVESLITIPIENSLAGLPGIQTIRSNSSFGLSVITAIFDENMDVYFARQLVQQRLNSVDLPPESPRPQLGPVVSSFSNVFMYYVEGPMNNVDLRTLQDWTIARRLKGVPGVGNVVSYGGFVKQYQILLSPDRLRSYDLSLADIVKAVNDNNANAGGNFIEQGGEEIVIRGIGRITSVQDIADIVVKEHGGTPVTLGDVAKISVGGAFRRGSASMDGQGEKITGIVLTRKGVNTKDVVQKVEKCIHDMQSQLPQGVRIVPYYNQMELVDKTMDTVREILFFSGALVIVVLTAVLLHVRAALIAAVIIPFSLLFSFVLMKFSGLSANLMTLGAVDFGVIVDAGVVMVENVFRHLSEAHHESPNLTAGDRFRIVLNAAQEVGKPIVFAILIIIAVYIPLFTLEGVEGKMFRPLALTFMFAIAGALVCALAVIPLLCYAVLRDKVVERDHPVLGWVQNAYRSTIGKVLSHPKPVVVSSVVALALTLCLVPFIGSEFIPSLDEGSILLRTKLSPSVSHRQSIEVSQQIESLIKSFPEVEVVVSRIGRSGMGSDLDGVDNADIYIGLKPKAEWKAHSKDDLINAMSKQLDQFPGVMYSFSQPIADMVDDLVSGVKADLAIKVFGDDLHELSSIAAEIEHAIRSVPGAADVQREHLLGLPELKIMLKRDAIARYGLSVRDVQQYIQTALAGSVITEVFEENKRFGVLVRFDRAHRDTAEDIANMQIVNKTGMHIPLKALAHISVEPGTVAVNREDAQRRTAVLANIRGRDLGSFVQEAQKKVAETVHVPRNVRIVWGGQFENQQRAMARLAIVVPVVLAFIFLLLFAAFNSLSNASLVMANVPFAVIGGIIALYVSHQPLSVPAVIGFIALFGVAVQNGIILVSYIKQRSEMNDSGLEQAITEAASVRLRPVLMTALVAITGLVPKIISTGTGSEIQRPLARVVLGGLISSTALTLLVLPVMYKLVAESMRRWQMPLRLPFVGQVQIRHHTADSTETLGDASGASR